MVGRAGLLNRAPSRGCGFKSHAFRFAPMVKWTSCLVSTERFRVRVLVGVLEAVVGGWWMVDGGQWPVASHHKWSTPPRLTDHRPLTTLHCRGVRGVAVAARLAVKGAGGSSTLPGPPC